VLIEGGVLQLVDQYRVGSLFHGLAMKNAKAFDDYCRWCPISIAGDEPVWEIHPADGWIPCIIHTSRLDRNTVFKRI
jgi:hypothetical protein